MKRLGHRAEVGHDAGALRSAERDRISGFLRIELAQRRAIELARASNVPVPAGKLPPSLTKVKLSGPKGKPSGKLSFRLDRKASLKLQVLKGKKVVFTAKKLHGRKGKNSLHPFKRKLGKGRYTLRLIATAQPQRPKAR